MRKTTLALFIAALKKLSDDSEAPVQCRANCASSATHWCGWHPLRAVNWLTTAGLLVLLLGLSGVPLRSQAQSLCATCDVFAGSGSTYHYWGDTGGVVLPVTVTWGNGRYELGYFRMSTEQVLRSRVMAQPYNGLSVSRRWELFEIGPVRMYFGFGLSGKSESDHLSVTRWDFASQLGVRFPWPGNRVVTELTMRHWSNGGVRLPNHGQDFATLTFKINTGWVGAPRTDQIAVDLPRALRSAQFASENRPGRSGFDEGVRDPQVHAGARTGMSDGFPTRAGEIALARTSGEAGH